mmetsp:Transcript_5025/g.12257  ORF Transcript_5025/g.12257 Transcript_5025/m.12257 type:complete len:85 (+) Transcript_5025:545-799(+)
MLGGRPMEASGAVHLAGDMAMAVAEVETTVENQVGERVRIAVQVVSQPALSVFISALITHFFADIEFAVVVGRLPMVCQGCKLV